MKKLFAILLVVAMLLALAGCAGGETSSDNPSNNSNASVSSSDADPIRIGIWTSLTGASAMHAANLGGVKLGDTVVILGAGCIGLTTLAACKAMSASKIIVTDLFQNRLDKALEMGADYAINGREEDTLARVMELTGGMGAHIVFETAGNRVTAAQTESLTRRGGTIVIVGNVMGDTPMNFYKIAHKELVIKTVHRYRNVFPLAIQAISDGKIDIEKIASDCFDFDNGIAAFEKSLCEKQAVVKAILKME